MESFRLEKYLARRARYRQKIKILNIKISNYQDINKRIRYVTKELKQITQRLNHVRNLEEINVLKEQVALCKIYLEILN